MIPLYDEKAPALKPPYVTLVLIGLISLISLIAIFGPLEKITSKWGLIPSVVLSGGGLLTLITHFFLHASVSHLVGNMWFLWLFGDNVEYNLGRLMYFIFFMLLGLTSGFLYVLSSVAGNFGDLPLVGTSGAISGLMGAYMVLFPKNKIKAWFGFWIFNVPAFVYIGIWFIYQFWYYISYKDSPVAYMAHIGGLIAGAALVFFFKRKIERVDYSEEGAVVKEPQENKEWNKTW